MKLDYSFLKKLLETMRDEPSHDISNFSLASKVESGWQINLDDSCISIG